MQFTHTFCRKKYRVSIEQLDGVTDQQNDGQRWLFVLRKLNTRAGLETAIHEALHACDWSASERKVTGAGKDIARLLWRLGYRKEE